ncbi:MAG: DUF2064 domain-containing protein [Coriobacteriales bacterium]|jgi:glycosyltransferase A (GT-A) superfamily protein (DUF2064 family)|nr:DUF2064 domain-containing protein [Coriobacteriales bacterium]
MSVDTQLISDQTAKTAEPPAISAVQATNLGVAMSEQKSTSSAPTTYKHALLMFSKPPLPGLVKTRLTRANGGIFSEEEAAELFHRSLFDVMELCLKAVDELEAEDALALAADPSAPRHEYHFFISTTPHSNVEIMRKTFEDAGDWPREFTYIMDSGANFDDHFDDAFSQIFSLGFDSVLSVGGDIPMLPYSHIINGFRWLQYFLEHSETGGLVQAPCQECGVSLIGWTRTAPMDHQEVYYNMTGRPALDAYVQKCGENNVPMASLTPVADVDDVQDLAHAISLARSARYTQQFQSDFYVPRRFLEWVDWRGLKVGTPPNEDRDSREGIDA